MQRYIVPWLTAWGLFSAENAFAEQFTLMDVTIAMTKEQADGAQPSPSHYYVYEKDLAPGQPADWTKPVDYRNGSLHLRTEVLEKPPGDEVTQWSVCYIPQVPIGAGYGCTNTGTYTKPGVYEVDQSMTEWWQNDQIDWTAGIKEMHLVIKDSDPAQGHAHKRKDHEKFFPTKVRMTLVQVSAGATYDEDLVPELSESGAKAGESADTAAAPSGAPDDSGAGDEAPSSGPVPPAVEPGGKNASAGLCVWSFSAPGRHGAWMMALSFFALLIRRRRHFGASRTPASC